ncbi:hypothetical protein [Vibrio sp. MEBiC08052]|uniref:hypothetical protein n=1 Tax=Vibrio sp. MEBiC08052 TaxID=1761910 RepID=UPI0007407922|nr:hypothetical protein [Vibrio sp. MEBiC08052]KUI97019.1 hypothetical protein VRK_38740 [Vibrio sp. MEBiC08052]
MSQVALKKISAKLATLHPDDSNWLLTQLPEDITLELRQDADKFRAIIETNRGLQDVILREYATAYQQARLKKSRLDSLSEQLSALDTVSGMQMNQKLPACLRNEFANRYGWHWLEPDAEQPCAKTASYVRERIFQLMIGDGTVAE